MKKLIVKIAILLVSFNSYSQSWNGIPISGSFSTIKTNLSAKGFTLINSENNNAFFRGIVNGVDYEVLVFATPITYQVAKLVLYLPKRTNWTDIKYEYEYMKDMLTEKYGIANSYGFFDSPYYEGDGYEMSAIEAEKCHYSSYWLKISQEPNLSVATEISKYKQVKVTYENKANMNKSKEETNNLNKKVF